jgi:hypothetical protein
VLLLLLLLLATQSMSALLLLLLLLKTCSNACAATHSVFVLLRQSWSCRTAQA